MDELERPPSLVPRIVLALVAVIVALTVVGWIIGAILSALRLVALVGICAVIIWAVVASRSE